MERSSTDESPEPSFIVLGIARLPKCIAGDHSGPLMVELVLDPRDDCIQDVATTVSLPGYTALLRRLLIGRRVDELEEVARNLCAHYRGPLLRPTMAALVNAVSNSKKETQELTPAMVGL